MPQIRCPNCGMTINLKKRKDLDVRMITEALKQGSKTFTDLLKITGLPRKTLNLRLKELCQNGILIKAEKGYKLNEFSDLRKGFRRSFGKLVENQRFKIVALLVLFIVGFPAFSYAMVALYSSTPTTPPMPKLLGSFTVVVEVNDVKDLYCWQVLIGFNESELTVLKTMNGTLAEIFVNASDIGEGALLLGGTFKGKVSGVDVNGSSSLAFITFGYYVENPVRPKIVMKGFGHETFLLDSRLAEIPITESTLNIKISD